jgi:hypothetical protein
MSPASSKGRLNPLIRVSPLMHARLKAAAAAERRQLIEVVEFAFDQYLRANHPAVISSVTHVPEPSGPVVEPSQLVAPKAPKQPRKPRQK